MVRILKYHMRGGLHQHSDRSNHENLIRSEFALYIVVKSNIEIFVHLTTVQCTRARSVSAFGSD